MTTDFMPPDVDNLEPDYPVVFGVTLTPMISGVLLGLGLVALAGAIWVYFGQAEWDKNQQLSAQVADKKAKLENQAVILKKIAAAKVRLEAARSQRQEVTKLFASESTLNTLLLDLNRQVDSRNVGLLQAKQNKLASCPAWVRNGGEKFDQELEQKGFAVVAKSQLKKFEPDLAKTGVIADSSYGTLVNNKLKRQTVNVEFSGNFIQTQEILRSIERLQPLLVLKNMDVTAGKDGSAGGSSYRLFELRGDSVQFLTNCQPEPVLTSKFQLEALLPLTKEEAAAAAAAAAPPAAAAK
jgi:type IV pilus assembly protein PilO